MSVVRLLVDGSERTDFPCIDQRAFQYGDGLFETIAIVDGRPCLWSYHLERLQEGCRRLRLPLPDPEAIEAEVGRICGGSPRSVLKLYWTAGTSERGYQRPQPAVVQRILALSEWPVMSSGDAWRIRTCEHRLSDNPVLAGIKHLNRLDQVIARAEWQEAGIREGLMRGQKGDVICGTMSNLFVQRGERLSTPSIEQSGIAGVVRRLAIEIADDSAHAIDVRAHTIEELGQVDALYLTNSLIGVVRVAQWDKRLFDPGIPEHPLMSTVRERCHKPEQAS
jgi:4-amino-4-deoxychorismate lyase